MSNDKRPAEAAEGALAGAATAVRAGGNADGRPWVIAKGVERADRAGGFHQVQLRECELRVLGDAGRRGVDRGSIRRRNARRRSGWSVRLGHSVTRRVGGYLISLRP